MRSLRWVGGALLSLLASTLACGGEDPPDLQAPEGVRVEGAFNAAPELVASLREDRLARSHPSDGGGRAFLDPTAEIPTPHAGGTGRFPILFEVGPEGIAEGGVVFLQVSPFWGWSPPQTLYPEAPGYTRVSTEAVGVELRTGSLERHLLGIEVAGRGLRAGERIRIEYGAGEAGARVDRFAERGARLWLAVDGDGDGLRRFLTDSPSVDVAPGPPARLILLLPSVARPGEVVELRASILDPAGSSGIAQPWTLELLEVPDGVRVAPSVAVPAESAGSTSLSLRAEHPGVVRLRARGPAGLEAESNPMLVAAEAPRILWADLHGHSNLSDGTGTPEDYYRYARDVAALDAAALTDHDHWGTPFLDESPELWEEIQRVTAAFHEPGRFVTLLGYEWTNWIFGHRHVLHFEDRASLRSSLDEDTDTPEELWTALRGQQALTFAHHSAGDPVATDWSIPPDPVLEPVTEIASVHGSSESADTPVPVRGGRPGNFVRDALSRGYRLGFVASGDSHDGHPGMAHLASLTGGVAAILSEERSRAGILSALRARRCYGTNGPRIVLWATLDGLPMGSALPAAEGHRLHVRVASPATLRAVELIADGAVVERVPADGRELEFESRLGASRAGGSLYVRVLQEDDGAAWSSPFFFD